MAKCDECKHGIIQVVNYKAFKNKEISRLEFARVAQKYGSKCFQCIHNGIGGRKAKLYARASASFQCYDLFESDEHETKEDRS